MSEVTATPVVPNGIVIASDKGGAGKSRVAGELAVAAAEAGWRTLAVDLDHQHGLGGVLGYHPQGITDEGRGLHDAILEGEPVEIIRDVCGRRGLDVIPAGKWTRRLKTLLASQNADPEKDLGTVISEINAAEGYDLVVFDSRPDADEPLLLQAIASVAFVAGVTKLDRNDLEGVRRLNELVERAHRSGWNPALELLGVVVVGWPREPNNETARYKEFAREIERDYGVRAFNTPVCEAGVAVADMIRRGMTSGEYAREIEQILGKAGGYSRTLSDGGWKLSVAGRRVAKSLKRKPEGRVVGGVELGGGLAGDCFDLTQEILGMVRARMDAIDLREDEASAATGPDIAVGAAGDGAAPAATWDRLLSEESA